jgi:hypothetical protein
MPDKLTMLPFACGAVQRGHAAESEWLNINAMRCYLLCVKIRVTLLLWKMEGDDKQIVF